MRKLISILLIAGLLFVCGTSYATMNRFNQGQNVLTYVSVNNAATTTVTNLVATTTIVPGTHRILGYEITPLATTGLYGIVGLWDSASATSPTNQFAESETTATLGSLTVWYPYPRNLTNGLVISQGAYTIVTVYYEYSYTA